MTNNRRKPLTKPMDTKATSADIKAIEAVSFTTPAPQVSPLEQTNKALSAALSQYLDAHSSLEDLIAKLPSKLTVWSLVMNAGTIIQIIQEIIALFKSLRAKVQVQ